MPPPEQLQPADNLEFESAPESAPRQFLQIAKNIKLLLVPKYWTHSNTFGLSRLYYGKPAHIPDKLISATDMVTTTVGPEPSKSKKHGICEAIWPYPNISSWRLGSWFWGQGDTKSWASFNELVNGVLLADDFRLDEIQDVAWDKISDLLAQISPKAPYGEGWCEVKVEIEVPTGIKKCTGEQLQNSARAAKTFAVPGLWYQPIPSLIKSVFSGDTAAESFHFNPYKQFWKTATGKLEQVHNELFNSDAWLYAQEEIEILPRGPDDAIPQCIAALMFWSDATHLAWFGQAKLWPIYLFFGNQSKWI